MEVDMGSEGKKASSKNPLERESEVAEDIFVPAHDVDNGILLPADDAVPNDDVAPYLSNIVISEFVNEVEVSRRTTSRAEKEEGWPSNYGMGAKERLMDVM